MDRRKRVFLAGAGPGDPDLITVRALKAIQCADVIIYDALVNEALLNEARPGCINVYVGKRCGKHSHRQEEINTLLLSYAQRFDNVLRLKGGDPYVFGRGFEEAAYLRMHGFEVEIIPGISSAVAAPGAAGIPVTCRGMSESFWVLTGTTQSHQLSHDIALAARSSATLVILMGLSHTAELMQQLAQYRGPTEPVAVISNATLPGQRVTRGTVGTIRDRVKEEGIATPAVIVVGAVAALPDTSMITIGTITLSTEILRPERSNIKVAV